MHGLGQVANTDGILASQVRDRSRGLEDSVVGPRGQPHAFDGRLKRLLARWVKLAEPPNFFRGHAGVGKPSLILDRARSQYPLANLGL